MLNVLSISLSVLKYWLAIFVFLDTVVSEDQFEDEIVNTDEENAQNIDEPVYEDDTSLMKAEEETFEGNATQLKSV